jgi:hypothetical protein
MTSSRLCNSPLRRATTPCYGELDAVLGQCSAAASAGEVAEWPGHLAAHVLDLGLERADDRAIWNRAIEMGAVILTKDEDFAVRKVLEKEGPRTSRRLFKMPYSSSRSTNRAPRSLCLGGSSRSKAPHNSCRELHRHE